MGGPRYHGPVVSRRPIIHTSLCKHCGTCAAFCHMSAIVLLDMDGHIELHPERCVGCRMCQRVCPEHAIELMQIEATAVMA
ncbi:MAG: 4Fe-4S binding protein [Methanomicrobiales archaeon]|nr:4Fe-4S binding protein [Methanomicrobiales archaeon]